MFRIVKIASCLAAVAVSTHLAAQTATIELTLSDFFDIDGNGLDNGVGVLVADTQGLGFGEGEDYVSSLFGADLTQDTWAGYDVIETFSTSTDLDTGGYGFSELINVGLTSELTAGTEIGLFFIDANTVDFAPVLGAGTQFNFFRTDDILTMSGATMNWTIPNPGESLLLAGYSDYLTGAVDVIDNLAFTTSFTVAPIPEPGTLMALAFGAFLPVWLRMRRNARARG